MKKKETAIQRIEKKMELINDFIALLDEAEKQNCELLNVVSSLDNRQQDILHEFELDKFYRTEGYRKARRLKKIRQTRRVTKDTIALWMPIKEFSKEHKKLKLELRDVVAAIKKVIHDQNVRVYKPRVDTGSCIAGKHFDPLDTTDMDELVAEEENRRKR